jgi:ankyrin repeat protein
MCGTSNIIPCVLAALLLTMAAMLMKLRCVVRRLLSPHPLVRRIGYTALHIAVGGGHESIVRLLLKYRADVNQGSR